jgi:type VII secretion EsaA-like protein
MPNLSRDPKRKTKFARFTSASLLLVVLVLGFLILNGDISQRPKAFQPTVALVNEDLAAEFNDKAYTFGANFVDRVSKDSEYTWTVLSRPIAEKAYKDGSVDAVIYLPQAFSHDILTLENVDPTKATVEYKLRPQVDEQSDRLLKSKIIEIVYGFNQSVVKMYYASIADNIAEADGYMHAALGNQEALIAALTSDVEEPLAGTRPNFEGFISSAAGLKDVNAATVEAQNSFTESVTNMLTGTSETFWDKLREVDGYASRQKEIAQINATNSNTSITNQAVSDRDFYGDQFDALKTRILCKLSGVDAAGVAELCKRPDDTVPTNLAALLASLRQATTDYTTEYAGSLGALQTTTTVTRNSLDTSITNLEALAALLEALATPNAPAVPTIDLAVLDTLKADIDALKNARDSLTVGSLPAPHFDTHLTDLDSWYSNTLTAVKDSALTSNAVNSLEVKDWNRYDPGKAEVYIDNSDELHQSIADLVTRTAETSRTIAGSSQTVPDNLPQFDALLKSAIATFTGAETVHNGVTGLLSAGGADLGKSRHFYRNFSTMLANTRTQGVDTGRIHDFFSAPIDAKNVTPERAAVTASTFDPGWMIVFATGLLAGILVTLLGRTFRTKKNA